MKLRFEVKEHMVSLAGACFWYWNSLYSFLDSCGVSRSVYQRYPRDVFNKYQAVRGIITDLETAAQAEVLDSLVSGFYRLSGAVDRDNLDLEKARTLLAEFRNLVGDDPIEAEIQKQREKEARDRYRESLEASQASTKRLQTLNDRFMVLASGTEHTPQQRGFELERLFFDLVHLSEIEHRPPYRTPGGEQIDGHFKFEKFDYLVETKWISGPVKPGHLAIFDGKIRGKAQSTRGLFLAAEGFDERAVQKYSGDSPRIVLTSGEDLALVLAGNVALIDLLMAKIDALVRYGRIDFPARSIP